MIDIDDNGNDKFWKERIEELGKDKAKKEWEENKNGDLNQRILAELTDKEKKEYELLIKRIETLFLEEKKEKDKNEKDNQELDYKPYLIGGAIGAGVIAFIWLLVVLIRRD